MTNVNSDHQRANKGFIIALISAVILSFTGIIIRMISEDYHLPALILAFWRDFFVVLCAFPFLLIFKSKLLLVSSDNLGYLILFGFGLACFNIAWTLAVSLSGASIATVLVYSSAGFTAILGFIFLNETLSWNKNLSISLCLVGCLLVSGAIDINAWQKNALGILSGILSGLLYAVYSLMGRRASQRDLNPWTTLFYTFLFAAIFLLLINFLPMDFIPAKAKTAADLFQLGTQWWGWLLLLILAGGPTLIGFGLYNVSLGLLPSSTANLILSSEPVMTVISAYFLLGERLTSIEIIGSGLILAALVLLRYRRA